MLVHVDRNAISQTEYQDHQTPFMVDEHKPKCMSFDNHAKQVVQADEKDASLVMAMMTLCGVVGILLVVVSAALMITSSQCLKSKKQR